MHGTNDGTMSDYTALDEELFGDSSSDDLHNNSQGTIHYPEIRFPDYQHTGATSGMSQAAVQITPQAVATSRSKSYSPSQAFPMSSGSPPTKNQHRVAPSEPMDTLDPIICSSATASASASASAFTNSGDSTLLITENISWMKARITDVHQLLLHYINLRNSHSDMAANFQKEMMLRSETKEALERIREQQDQTSEDIPRLQFQIAQLKLDVQNERAARTAAETDVVDINQKLCSYDELFSSMQSRLSEYQERENKWQREKEVLTSRIEGELAGGTRRNITRDLSLEHGSPTGIKGIEGAVLASQT